MSHVRLAIEDGANRLTLEALLKADGHTVGDHAPDVTITDDAKEARELARAGPTLLLTSTAQLREAVHAMEEGVFGYIVLPLLPGEAQLMVRRATGATVGETPFAPRTLQEVESDHILAVLRHCKNNRAKAARILGIGRNTLWRKLKSIEQKNRS